MSLKKKIKKNYEIILLITIVILTKVIFTLSKTKNYFWDESVYIGISKYITSMGAIGLFEEIRPITLPFFISSIDLLVQNKEITASLTITIFTIGSILMTYLIGRELLNKYIGLIGAALLFITPIFFTYTNNIMTGIPALFFSLLSIYLCIKKRFIASGIFIGITFMTRFPIGLILPIINLIIISRPLFSSKIKNYRTIIKNIMKKKYDLLKLNISFLIIFIAFLIYNRIMNGSFIKPLLLASEHQSTLIGNIFGAEYLLYYPTMIIATFFSLLLPLYIIFDKNQFKNDRLKYLVMPLLAFLTYFVFIPHKQERFIIIIIPFLTLLTGYTIYNILDMTKEKRLKILIILLFLITLIQPIALNVKHINSFPEKHYTNHDEYFGFLTKLDGPLTILTSDPLPAAYTDHRYIPFYQDTTKALETVKKNINHADLIIYSPHSFPWNDDTSIAEKEEMLNIIRSNSRLVLNTTYIGATKEIYLVNK